MKTYRSKIQIVPILLTFFIIGGIGHAIFNSPGILMKVLYAALLLMALHIVFAKKYVIDDDLIIKIAGFRSQVIPFKRIQKIKKLESVVDSGLRLNRLMLVYNTNDDFDYIAPKKQEVFIKELIEKNSKIEVSGFPATEKPSVEEGE